MNFVGQRFDFLTVQAYSKVSSLSQLSQTPPPSSSPHPLLGCLTEQGNKIRSTPCATVLSLLLPLVLPPSFSYCLTKSSALSLTEGWRRDKARGADEKNTTPIALLWLQWQPSSDWVITMPITPRSKQRGHWWGGGTQGGKVNHWGFNRCNFGGGHDPWDYTAGQENVSRTGVTLLVDKTRSGD